MRGVVLALRHGEKEGELISEQGKKILRRQGRDFAKHLLESGSPDWHSSDNQILKKRGVEISLEHTELHRTKQSAVAFAIGFRQAMKEAGIDVKINKPVENKLLTNLEGVDSKKSGSVKARVMKKLKEKYGENVPVKAFEARYLNEVAKAAGKSDKSVSNLIGVPDYSQQGKRVATWARKKLKQIDETIDGKPVPVIIGFTHEPLMGSAFGQEHPQKPGEKYFTKAGPKPLKAGEGLAYVVSSKRKVFLNQIKHYRRQKIATSPGIYKIINNKFNVDYIGQIT